MRHEAHSLWDRQSGRCAYCGVALSTIPSRYVHIEHVQPKSLGGLDTEDNKVLACMWCNSAKDNMQAETWIDFNGVSADMRRFPKTHTLRILTAYRKAQQKGTK